MLPSERRDQPPLCPFVRNTVINGIELQRRNTRKRHLRCQSAQQTNAKQRKMNVRRPPCIVMISPGIGSGLDGSKRVSAFRVGNHPSATVKVWIKRSVMLVELVLVSAGRVG